MTIEHRRLPVIATAAAKKPGLLDCGCVAVAGQRIVKIDVGDRGPQTSHGNGRGRWYCLGCAVAADDDQPA